MKDNDFYKNKLEADADGFEGLAAAAMTYERDQVAWFVNLRHAGESFQASLPFLAKVKRIRSVTFSGEPTKFKMGVPASWDISVCAERC